VAINAIQQRYALLKPTFNERTLRLFAAAEASAIGRGGIKKVSKIVGIERHTIARGIRELNSKKMQPTDRIRQAGAGRKKATIKNTALLPELEKLVEPATRGDPESPLRYTSKSTRKLADELCAEGHPASHELVARLLRQENYSLQANRKTHEGSSHPDRNAQFEFINADVKKQLQKHEPVISVDTKKKELVGNFKNSGREWRPKGHPREVKMHDFVDKKLGKVIPYGVLEIDQNHGWINLGIDHDTAEFAVESIRRWWKKIGRRKYPKAKSLTITADSGGSNSSRSRLWKFGLSRLSNQTGLTIRVRHFPPGTSKWNKIEHRLFSFISKNWIGKPLVSIAMIINLIAATKTKTGLKVDCVLDENKYPTGLKISDEEFAEINLKPDSFHGDWNYIIAPNITE
jgi:hypothetical protein